MKLRKQISFGENECLPPKEEMAKTKEATKSSIQITR
jgi:hypothetical protein